MFSDMEKRVLNIIDDNRDEIVKYLQSMINYKTVTPLDGEGAGSDDFIRHQEMISQTLAETGFNVESWDIDPKELKPFPGAYINPERKLEKMPVVVGTLKGTGNGKSLILNGHYDVVPEGIPENWTHDPFGGEVDTGRIFGRGACDMKGGIAAMIQAAKYIKKAGIKTVGDIIMQVVPDEEATSMGTLSCCQRGYTADAAIIPEPTNLDILLAVRGNLSGLITVHGRAGHGDVNQPHWQEGGAVNAITKAAKVIMALEELNNEWRDRPDMKHKYLDPAIITPTIIHGGSWSVSVPEKVEIEFTSDFLPGYDKLQQEIEDKLAALANTDSWMKQHPPELEAGIMYGAETDENELIVKCTFDAISAVNKTPDFIGWGTLSDAIHLVNYLNIPTISIGPDSKTAHEAEEFITVDDLIKTTKTLALVIMRWCGTN
ncbi:MAG: ArgE/DapE family deacylase [Desulfobacterales bacterium]|nr:ArgE/DapE family deacylase [Desulfobacterales bacterium]